MIVFSCQNEHDTVYTQYLKLLLTECKNKSKNESAKRYSNQKLQIEVRLLLFYFCSNDIHVLHKNRFSCPVKN